VLLQLLHVASAADRDDHPAFVRNVHAAAGSLKMAEALGLVTSIAGALQHPSPALDACACVPWMLVVM
jgi:hypothetical protein